MTLNNIILFLNYFVCIFKGKLKTFLFDFCVHMPIIDYAYYFIRNCLTCYGDIHLIHRIET